jgi:hypothetical protein
MKTKLLFLLFLLPLSLELRAQVANVTIDANGNVLNGKIVNFATGKLSINGVLLVPIPAQTGHGGEYLTTNGTAPSWVAIPPPSDTVFGSSWNSVTTVAPSKNAIYDYVHLFDTDDDGKVNVLDQVAGIPVTDAAGVLQAPITDNSANWNTAYTDRFKWDGGSTGLVA